jgi:Arc/MetJ-type ribon-helix-helix transcriptional regulator
MPEFIESFVGRPTKRPDERTVNLSVTLPEPLRDRLYALRASTPLSASEIIAAALRRTLDDFEKDPGEMLRG